MDRCCIYHNLYIILDVGGTLSVKDTCSLLGKGIGKRAFFGIRAGNNEIFLKQDLSQSTHTDTANPDKVDMKRFVEVYLIHNKNLLNEKYKFAIVYLF